jgi:MFS family permease
MHEIVRALRIPAFGRLAATYTLNDLAHFLATIALSILVYDATKSAFATTGLFLAAEFLPAFVVPALAARVDGIRPGRLLAGAYVVEAVLLGGIALIAGSFWLPAVLVLAFVNGTLAATARAVTRSASVVILKPAGALRSGNAALNVGFAVNSAAGPAAAGGLVALLGTAEAIGVAAALFAFLAALIAGMRAVPAGEIELADWRHRLGEAIAHVRANPTLRTLLLGEGLALALFTMVVPIQVIYAKESLDAGNLGFGIFAGAWGLGMVLGSGLFAREHRRSMTQLIVGSTAALGLGYVGIAVAPTLLAACLAAILGGLGNGIQVVSVITALQEATEERFYTRVAGLFEAIATAAPGVGFLVGGAVTAFLSPRAAFGVAGAGVLMLVLGALALGGLRSISRAEPAPEPAS